MAAAIAMAGCVGRRTPQEDRIEGEVVRLETAKASCEVALYGGRVLSFRTERGEAIWRPKYWNVAGKRWSHGGIPICWPWFGSSGADPKVTHGFAWKVPFAVRRKEIAAEKCTLVLGLVSNAETKSMWPYDFDLEYTITLTDRLSLELKTKNTGTEAFALTAGFHPYFLVGERDSAKITGTDGLSSCDSRVTTEYSRLWKGDLPLNASYDDVFVEPRETAFHALVDTAFGRRITESSTGAARLVVWNPGPEGTDEDDPEQGALATGDWRRMVCMEPAILWKEAARRVEPGATHVLATVLGVEGL